MDVELNEIDSVDSLYALFNKIKENQSLGNSTENGPLFDKILSEYATSSAEPHIKRLSAQLTCRLLPDLVLTEGQQKAALNALIDLIEDDDAQTRRQVISGLPRLCAGKSRHAEYTNKVAHVLVQLMQTEDEKELSLVQQSLLSALNADTLAAVDGIFAQLSHADLPESARHRSIRFLADRLLCVNRDRMTSQVEEAIVDRVQACLDDVSEAEFASFIRILASLQCMQTVSGRQRLVDIITAQATDAIDPSQPAQFDAADPACVARLRGCVRQALPFLSKSISAEKFISYFLDQVVPQIGRVPELVDGDDRPRLELLQQLADLSGHSGLKFEATYTQLDNLMARIGAELPQSDNRDLSKSDCNFSHLECLLMTLHQLGSTNLQYFADQSAAMGLLRTHGLRDFQAVCRTYQKSLQKPAAAAADRATDTDSTAASVVMATVSNVVRLIDGLVPNQVRLLPVDTVSFLASWRVASSKRRCLAIPNRPLSASMSTSSVGVSANRKRPRDIVDLPTYRPPAGKYSAGVGAAPRGAHTGAGLAQGGRSRYYNVYTGSAKASGLSNSAGKRS